MDVPDRFRAQLAALKAKEAGAQDAGQPSSRQDGQP